MREMGIGGESGSFVRYVSDKRSKIRIRLEKLDGLFWR